MQPLEPKMIFATLYNKKSSPVCCASAGMRGTFGWRRHGERVQRCASGMPTRSFYFTQYDGVAFSKCNLSYNPPIKTHKCNRYKKVCQFAVLLRACVVRSSMLRCRLHSARCVQNAQPAVLLHKVLTLAIRVLVHLFVLCCPQGAPSCRIAKE